MNETATLTNKDKFLSHFDLVDFSMDEDFSSDVRKEAMELIQWLDFPTSKAEYWKYTRVNKIIKGDYKISAPENEIEIDLSIPTKNCIVLINGYFSEELSFFDKTEGIEFSSLSHAKKEQFYLERKVQLFSKER